jgi:hypothetical protein
MPSSRHAILSEIAPYNDDGELRIVIETPKGSRNKYSYEPDCDCMQLSTVPWLCTGTPKASSTPDGRSAIG